MKWNFAQQESFEAHLEVLRLVHRGSVVCTSSLPPDCAVTSYELDNAVRELQLLGAIDERQGMTTLGRRMEPFIAYQHNLGARYAKVVLGALDAQDQHPGLPYAVAALCAILTARTPFLVYRDAEGQFLTHTQLRLPGSSSDLSTLLNAFRNMSKKSDPRVYARDNGVSLRAFQEADTILGFLLDTMRRMGCRELHPAELPPESLVTETFLPGFLDRLLHNDRDDWCTQPSSPYYSVTTPPDSVQGMERDDLVLGLGMVYIKGSGSPNYGRRAFVALAPVSPERVAELTPGETVMTRWGYRFCPTRQKVTCHESWGFASHPYLEGEFCKRYWQEAPASPETAQVLAAAIQSGDLPLPESVELKRYREAVLRAGGELPHISTDDLRRFLTQRLARCTDAASIQPNQLHLGWPEIGQITHLTDSLATVLEVESRFPSEFALGSQMVRVAYDDHGFVYLHIKGFAEATAALAEFTGQGLPLAWAGRKVFVHVTDGCAPQSVMEVVNNLDNLRREVACRLALNNFPRTPTDVYAKYTMPRIIQTVEVRHPEHTEVLYMVFRHPGWAQTLEEACLLRNSMLMSYLGETAREAGRSLCPQESSPDLADTVNCAEEAAKLLEYGEDSNATLWSVEAASTRVVELITALLQKRLQLRDELRRRARVMELHFIHSDQKELRSAIGALVEKVGYKDSALPSQCALDVAQQQLSELENSHPLAQTEFLALETEIELIDMFNRAGRGYGDPKHKAKQAIDRAKRLLRQDKDVAAARAMLPEIQALVQAAESSEAPPRLRGGVGPHRSNRDH